MADQIEISIPKPQVSEKSAFTATAYFRTRSTAAASTPTTVHYRVDDLSTRTTIRDWTSVTPGESVSISITATDNAIQSNSKQDERRQLMVSVEKGTASEVVKAAQWKVRNLYGIT